MGGVVVARDELVPALFIGGLVAYSAYEVTKRIAPRPSALPTPWGIAYQQVAPIPQQIPLLNNPPATTSVQGRVLMPSEMILTAGEAYQAARSGNIYSIRNRKMSRHYKWGEFIDESTPDGGNWTRVSESIFRNASNHAANLDRLVDAWGSHIKMISWYRGAVRNRQVGGASNSRHLYGDGTDVDGNMQMKIKLAATAERIGWNGGMGKPVRQNKLHFDSRGYKARWTY
jgi:hypothetical protein